MNFILKIIQGPNAGAEIALVACTTVSFGRGESCDIVLGDQMLPEKAGELVVEDAQVVLTLPDGTREPLAPLHVRSFETTAIAVGPADAPWGELVWPTADAKPAEAPKPETAPAAAAAESAEAPKPETAPPAKGRRLQLTLLVLNRNPMLPDYLPRLIVMEQPVHEMGRKAVEVLLERSAQPNRERMNILYNVTVNPDRQ